MHHSQSLAGIRPVNLTLPILAMLLSIFAAAMML